MIYAPYIPKVMFLDYSKSYAEQRSIQMDFIVNSNSITDLVSFTALAEECTNLYDSLKTFGTNSLDAKSIDILLNYKFRGFLADLFL